MTILADEDDPRAVPAPRLTQATEYGQVTSTLENAIRWLRVAAVVTFAFGAAATAFAIIRLPNLTSTAVEKLAESDYSATLTIFELMRSAAFAGLVASLVWGLLGLGRACLDQATRYQKRLVAAHFVSFVLLRYEQDIRDDKMTVADAVQFMQAWSQNVESAFTNVKFGKGHSDNVTMRLNKDGTYEFSNLPLSSLNGSKASKDT